MIKTMHKLSILVGLLLVAGAAPALATEITAHVGPPSVGAGGANPVSVPPTNPLEWEFEYVTDKDYEFNLAATPGLLFGARSENSNGVYVSFGGGLVISSNGAGPGVYSSFGYNSGGKTYKFNAEVKQAVGFNFSTNALISPYALRLGMTFAL